MSWTVETQGLSKPFEIASGQKGVLVHMGSFVTVGPNDAENYMRTTNTSACAGIVLLPHDPSDKIGMMHINVDIEKFKKGQHDTEQRVKKAWKALIKDLSPTGEYTAVLFGGIPPLDNIGSYVKDVREASIWTNNALMKHVNASDFIPDMRDYRYTGMRDAIIDRNARRLLLDKDLNALSNQLDQQTSDTNRLSDVDARKFSIF